MLAGAAILALAVSPIFAQEQSQSATPTAQPDPAAQTASSTMSDPGAAQTFTGKIAKAGGKYVLKDSSSSHSYVLDDQTRAKEYEGKTVKVTGKLDVASNTIVVSAIEAAS
jgi:hypothetical protein